METSSIQSWLQQAKAAGLSEQQIRTQLAASGWTQEQISAALRGISSAPSSPFVAESPQKTGRDRLRENPQLQTYQRILIWWLVAYLLIRLMIILIAAAVTIETASQTGSVAPSAAVGSFLFGFIGMLTVATLIPGVIILIGIIQVRAWAYWFYGLGMLSSLTSFMSAKSTLSLILGIILTAGSTAVLFIIFKLYGKLFPSKLKVI